MLAALVASGRSASEFAKAVGIGLHRVNYWRMKLDGRSTNRGGQDDAGGFVAIEVRDDVPGRDDARDRRVEVTLANGRRVAFSGTWDAGAVAPWLRALEDRCSG